MLRNKRPEYHAAIMVKRQLEMLNVLAGFEQANTYIIHGINGSTVGRIVEENTTVYGSLLRQLLKTHRPFHAQVLDSLGKHILTLYRPFKLISSRMIVLGTHNREIGLVEQSWHLLRRRYNLFCNNKQFAYIDGQLLTWDFYLLDESSNHVASINRNFAGFARELFTDTGEYAVRFGNMLNLDQRSVVLACAVNADIDYFSRAGGMPLVVHDGTASNTEATQSPDGAVIDGSLHADEPAESSDDSDQEIDYDDDD
jgi:hypothetical protein